MFGEAKLTSPPPLRPLYLYLNSLKFEVTQITTFYDTENIAFISINILRNHIFFIVGFYYRLSRGSSTGSKYSGNSQLDRQTAKRSSTRRKKALAEEDGAANLFKEVIVAGEINTRSNLSGFILTLENLESSSSFSCNFFVKNWSNTRFSPTKHILFSGAPDMKAMDRKDSGISCMSGSPGNVTPYDNMAQSDNFIRQGSGRCSVKSAPGMYFSSKIFISKGKKSCFASHCK